MFLLITGASGAGKSTVRRAVAPALAPTVQSVELVDLIEMPRHPTLVWRQQATEVAVQRALELQESGVHLLLSGDPVAAGEVLAAPSAPGLDGIAACLLDVSADAQAARLAARGDDPALIPHHQAFAKWMRGHAEDPRHMPHVLTDGGWEAMRWDRWADTHASLDTWRMEVIDTTRLPADQLAAQVLSWCRRAIAGQAPLLSAHAFGN